VHNTDLTAHGVSMSEFIKDLSGPAQRNVIDMTGLTGKYDLTLNWSREDDQDSTAPSIFTAVQEQLGLKLEPAKGPVETLVVDHVEMPSAN
jgi:uncharacterized protein (TIGR03435 family)